MTYRCPHCGKPCLTEKEAAAHCASSKRPCPTCNGKGQITGGIFEPNRICPTCKGSGVV